ncbi:peptide deformylase [Rhodothermus marinus]|uniref:peptide deformylase n=1 Tax=Rhodothermus marinus TaxID=29549 RepID=UPI0012BA539E|nr:peptide deformylase [Rhodothermus marinus]BBM69061.1 peptide deformylase [Rhodothermus marinus]BBM72039.1 peptide deformylase [Rhodothermus marinus]
MVLPIHVYGDPILRERAQPVEADSPELQQLLDDMVETMHAASGIGLAAPQVGRRERVFVVDLTPMKDELEAEGETLPPMPMFFINPELVWTSEEQCSFEEGCLSIPDVREVVERPAAVRIRYLDRQFRPQELEVRGMLARVIQHEYDHLEGILFIDRISAFRRQLLRRRLREIARGQVSAEYPLALSRV